MSTFPKALGILALGIISLASAQTPPPVNLQGEYSGGKVHLVWQYTDTLSGQRLFYVYRTGNADTIFSRLGYMYDSTHFADAGVALNAVYRYYVTATVFPDSIESSSSNVIEVHTGSDAGPPQPPTGLEGHSSGATVFLDWHEPVYPIHPSMYRVYRRADADTGYAVVGTPASKEFQDDHASLNTLYHYYVTAVYHDTIESGPSGTIGVLTGRPPAPRNLSGHVDNGNAVLDWERPDNDAVILWYNVYRYTFPDSLPAVIGMTSDTLFVDTTFTLTPDHYYNVSATYAQDSLESFRSNTIVLPSHEVAIQFTTTPPQKGLIHHLYQYEAGAQTNPPGHTVCFSLDHAPDGMTVDPSTGSVQWTPVFAGVYGVVLKARICDSVYAVTRQEFHISVFSGSPGRVEGDVRVAGGGGLRGVRIKLFDVSHGEFVLQTFTDDTGHYGFPFVNPATYFVRARPDSEQYAPQWYNGAAEIDSATPVVVTDSATVTINFTLQRRTVAEGPFSLSGTVVDTAHEPIGGARVMVFLIVHDRPLEDLLDGEEGDHDLVTTALTDQNGTYSVMLPNAHYIVGALREGYFPQFWNHKNSPLEANIISLDHNTSGINFDLSPSGAAFGVLTGTLFSAVDSSRLRGLVLGFHKPAPDSAFSGIVVFTNTDLSGNYYLPGMPNGYYVVLALPRGEFVPTFYTTTGGTPFHDSATAVGVFGDSVGGINIYALPDSVQGLNSVSGTVQTATPTIERAPSTVTPLGGAIVTIFSTPAGGPVGSALTLADGSYAVAGLAPGSYTVVFQKPGKSTVAGAVSLSYNNNTPSMMTLDAELTNQSGGSGHIGTMSVQQGWNLISLPVTVADKRRTAVFPNAGSPAFRYENNSGYVASTDLDYPYGYWVKFPLVQAFTVQGTARTSQTIPVLAGWNLIGSVSTSVPVSSIQTSSPNLIRSGFFGYDLGYTLSSSIQPGKGYWVKSTAAGTVTLQSGPSVISRSDGISRELSELNSITIRDAAGFSQVLYFGRTASLSGSAGFEMPPVAPPGAFDVRFASQHFAEIRPAGINMAEQYPILIQAVRMPLTLKWSVRGGGTDYVLTDGSGKPLIGKPLSGTGTATIDRSSLEKMVLEARPVDLPKAFALHQNYPNPFNPSSVIQYELPQDAIVSLKVYNILGQETATLINDFEVAGYKSTTFDARNYPSGVYFYRLQAGKFVDVKKMVLIR